MTEELKPIDVSKYRITETGQVLKMNKEELKDEMKNRISMALKDPILQQGFEIICKENAELKELLNCQNCCELEESECETCAEFGHFRCKGKKQLTNAKELLKMALDWQGRCGNGHPTWQEVCVKIEQFLKDSEVEK